MSRIDLRLKTRSEEENDVRENKESVDFLILIPESLLKEIEENLAKVGY